METNTSLPIDVFDIEQHLLNYRPHYRTFTFSNGTLCRCHFPDGAISEVTMDSTRATPTLRWLFDQWRPFADELDKPWALVNGDYFMHATPQLSDADWECIRTNGLSIFLYEPLFICNADGSWPWQPKLGPPCFPELEKISHFFSHLDGYKITVYLSEKDLNLEILKRQEFENLDLQFFNSYAMETVQTNNQYNWRVPREKDLRKKFICLNFRYEACREIIVAYLKARGFLEQGHVSFLHRHEQSEFFKRLPFDPRELAQWSTIENGIYQIQPLLPLVLDVTHPQTCTPSEESIPDLLPNKNQKSTEARDEFYKEALLCIYTESRPFSFRGEVSEKTLDAIYRRKPFLVFAAPYFLKQLQDLGFKTFSKFWDESFDTCEDPRERFDKYLNTVDSVLNWDWNRCKEFFIESQKICEHNHQWAKSQLVQKLQCHLLGK